MLHLSVLFLLTPVKIFREQSFLVVKASLHLFKLILSHIEVKAKAPKSGYLVCSNTLVFDILWLDELIERDGQLQHVGKYTLFHLKILFIPFWGSLSRL